MRPLAELLTMKTRFPEMDFHMPLDREYCYVPSDDFVKLHWKWQRFAKWFGIWKYIVDGNDCDDAAYEEVGYIKRALKEKNPLVCVVIDTTLKHAYICVWHGENDYEFYEPKIKQVTMIENPSPSRLERL